MRVSLSKSGFCLHHGWLRKERHDWSDIRGVGALWQTQENYQHLELRLTLQDRTERSLSELIPGFAAFEARLPQHLRGFPSDWRLQVEDSPAGVHQRLWGR